MNRTLEFLTSGSNGYYFRKITYENDKVIEWEDNWGVNGIHYKMIDEVWTCLKEYKPKFVNPRTRKHNFWDK